MNENMRTKTIYVFQYLYQDDKTWEDCHDFKTKKQAVSHLSKLRIAYPQDKYRLIKRTITEEEII